MKYTFKPTPPPTFRLPEVGECWKHSDQDNVFMRISDSDGKKIFPNMKNCFYSVCLSSGMILWCSFSEKDIVLVESDCVFSEKLFDFFHKTN